MAKITPEIDATQDDFTQSIITETPLTRHNLRQQNMVLETLKKADNKTEATKEQTISQLKMKLKVNDTVAGCVALATCLISWFSVSPTQNQEFYKEETSGSDEEEVVTKEHFESNETVVHLRFMNLGLTVILRIA
jgi:hypothetical protein